jgi:hypothetical protein
MVWSALYFGLERLVDILYDWRCAWMVVEVIDHKIERRNEVHP